MVLNKNLGFIGGGQMAEAIIKGLLAAEIISPENIIVSEPLAERRAYLGQTYPDIQIIADNKELIKRSDIVIVAVKPQVITMVLKEIALTVKETNPLIISIAAGIPLSFLESLLPKGTRVIRVMPNTPALVLAGVSAYTPGKYASSEDLTLARTILSALGECIELEETHFDAVTGLSGSGPAFVAMFIEGLIDGGVRVGLPRPVAEKLALETVLGTAKLLKEAQKNPYEIKAMVTSPGGTTISGVEVLAKGGLCGLAMEAVVAATQRSKELVKALNTAQEEL